MPDLIVCLAPEVWEPQSERYPAPPSPAPLIPVHALAKTTISPVWCTLVAVSLFYPHSSTLPISLSLSPLPHPPPPSLLLMCSCIFPLACQFLSSFIFVFHQKIYFQYLYFLALLCAFTFLVVIILMRECMCPRLTSNLARCDLVLFLFFTLYIDIYSLFCRFPLFF